MATESRSQHSSASQLAGSEDLEGGICLPSPTGSTDYSSSLDAVTQCGGSHEQLRLAQQMIEWREKEARYALFTKALAKQLPHLQNVLHTPRIENVCVAVIDSTGDTDNHLSVNYWPKTLARVQPIPRSLRSTLHASSANLRIIVVEDLSTSVIQLLGSSLKLSPEVFEEHLVNSGWRDIRFEDSDPKEWNTQGLSKRHCSICWNRPVKVPTLSLVSARMRQTLVRAGYVRWVPDENLQTGSLKKRRSDLITNIIRSDWDLHKRIALADLENLSESTQGLPRRSVYQNITFWEERVTIWRMHHNGNSILLLLFDPVPTLVDRTRRGIERPLYVNHHPRVAREGQEDLFTPDIDITHLEKLPNALQSRTSTAIDFLDSITNATRASSLLESIPPALAQIVLGDVRHLLQIIDSGLGQMGRYFHDDGLVQAYLSQWLDALEDIHSRLRGTRESIDTLFAFLATERGPTLADERQTILAEIEELRKRTSDTSSALMSGLSRLETKRSLAEAESVTKLTEIAFLFIPLTFAASIFSMSVTEISQHDISITAFVAVSLITMGILYGIRLVIRSSWFVRGHRKLFKSIRVTQNVPHGQPTPNSAFVVWIFDTAMPRLILNSWAVGKFLAFGSESLLLSVLVALFAMVILLPLWLSELIRQIKVAITVVTLCFVVLGEVAILLWRKYGTSFRERSSHVNELDDESEVETEQEVL